MLGFAVSFVAVWQTVDSHGVIATGGFPSVCMGRWWSLGAFLGEISNIKIINTEKSKVRYSSSCELTSIMHAPVMHR